MSGAPDYLAPVWVDGQVTNKGPVPLWSGKGPPPAVGDVVTCNDRHGTRVTVTGYKIEAGWLMVEGFRTDAPSVRGDLSGWEIAY